MTKLSLLALTALLANTATSLAISGSNSSEVTTHEIIKRTDGKPLWYAGQRLGSAPIVKDALLDSSYQTAVAKGQQRFQHLEEVQTSTSAVRKAGSPRADFVHIGASKAYGWQRTMEPLTLDSDKQPAWAAVLDFKVASGRGNTWVWEQQYGALSGGNIKSDVVGIPSTDAELLPAYKCLTAVTVAIKRRIPSNLRLWLRLHRATVPARRQDKGGQLPWRHQGRSY